MSVSERSDGGGAILGRRRGPRSLLAAAALLALGGRASLAEITGSIAGRVVGPDGNGLPGVTIEATSRSLQGTRVAVTGPGGAYRLPAVPPGPYRVRATLAGFQTVEVGATVSLDATATVDVAMRLATEEQVVVHGEAPLIDVTATTGGTNYTSQVVAHLPAARNYADIVRSQPGVSTDKGVTQGRSLALSIYGATSAENQWIIDNVNTTNVQKGIQGKAINNEFVQEVEVKTGGYQAEYGRALGGVVNVITKSGGNEFHGDGFVYFDNGAMQADRVFVPGTDSNLSGMRTASYTRTDFGVDVGGFIVKDRLWIFGAYDRVQIPSELSRYVASPLVPTTLRFPLDGVDNLYSGKLTWNASAGTTVVGTVFADPTTQSGDYDGRTVTNPDPGTWQADRTIGGTDYGLRVNQLFGASALASLQAARHQDKFNLTPTGAAAQARFLDFTCDPNQPPGTPDQPCDIPGEENYSSGGLGLVWGPRNHGTSHRDQIRADLTVYAHNNEVKVGGDYQKGATQGLSFYTGGQQVSRYNEFGQVYYQHEFYNQSLDGRTPTDLLTQANVRDYGAYLQDSWRPAPNLTINAGLRYDRESVYNYTGQAVITTNQWEPRIGVVWDPSRNGTTKIYGFAGKFSYQLPTDIAIWAFGPYTAATTWNFDPVGVVQDPNVIKHPRADVCCGVGYAEPVDAGLEGMSQWEFALGAEKTIGTSLSLGLKATYRRLSGGMEDRCDLDVLAEENLGNSCAITSPGSGGRWSSGDFHYCNGLDQFNNCTWDAETDVPLSPAPAVPPMRRLYRGIELLARDSITDRAWVQASFVFSSLRGNYDGAVSELFGQTSPGINADFDYAAFAHYSYGRLFLDRPYRLRLDGFYQTPFRLIVGLQAWLMSGAPLNKMGYFNWGWGSLIQLVPRGYAGRLPMEWDANLTLEYPFQFGPLTVTLQGFVFNLFNNQIPNGQDTVWSDQQSNQYPNDVFDPNQPQSNTNYGRVTRRTGARLFRAAVKVSF